MTPQEEKDAAMKAMTERIMKECDKEFAEYYVHSGEQVFMSDRSKYVVAMTILGTEMSMQFSDGKIWKLFSLVHIDSGTNYSYPVPVMSQGIVDIRKLMGVGRYPIQSVVFKKKDAQNTRHYTVVDESGYIKTMKVKG